MPSKMRSCIVVSIPPGSLPLVSRELTAKNSKGEYIAATSKKWRDLGVKGWVPLLGETRLIVQAAVDGPVGHEALCIALRTLVPGQTRVTAYQELLERDAVSILEKPVGALRGIGG